MTPGQRQRRTAGRGGRGAVGVAVALLGLLAAALVVGPVAPVSAAPAPTDGTAPDGRVRAAVCTPIDVDDSEALATRAEGADAVFAGEVLAVGRTRIADPGGRGFVRVWRHRVQVVADYQGVVGDGSRVKVDIDALPGATPTSLTAGSTYLFFVTEDGTRLVADPCNGALLLRDGLTEPVAQQLDAALGSSPTSVEVTLERVSGISDDPPEIGRLVAPGAALALIGLLGLLLVSRLGRERR